MAYSDEDLIKAALMDDPEDQEEEKSADTKEVAAGEDGKEKSSEVVTPPEKKVEKAEDEGNEDPKADPAKGDPEEEEANEDAKQTRKEKREERKKNFLESIKSDQDTSKTTNRERVLQTDPNYKPVNYDEADSLDVKVLNEDRSKYGQKSFAEGAKTERFYADQENFWTRTEYEGKLLESNPKYAFLDETNPDTFDADKAEELNGMYLELVGFDAKTNTVRRTDLSYDKFVKHEVERMERWAESQNEDTASSLATQASNSGIRPSGSTSKGLGKLKPGDISKMSDEDFAKHEAEIDRQILAELS